MSRPNTARLRVTAAAIGLLIVSSVAGCAAAVTPGSSTTPEPSARATGATTVAAPTCTSPTPRATAGPNAPILFVGASYTAGLGASSPQAGYATLTARALHRPARIDAVSGSGFLATGHRPDGTFLTRVNREPVAPRPGLIVFQGGRNDAGFAPAQFRSAVVRTVLATRHRFAGATIVFLGPVPASLPVSPQVLAVARTLDQVARACRVTMVDPVAEHWITVGDVTRFAGPVPAHPNDAGYAYLARRLVRDLQAGTASAEADAVPAAHSAPTAPAPAAPTGA